MATTTINYGSNTTIAIDLANLASSSTFVAGYESAQLDNTTNKFLDAIVQGVVSVGTTPTTNTSINIYAYGSNTSLATTAIDALDGTESAVTLTNSGVLYSAIRLAAVISVLDNTSDVAYDVAPFSVAQLFGGVLPKYWGLFVAHNTGVNLRNTAVNTDAFSYYGVKYDIA